MTVMFVCWVWTVVIGYAYLETIEEHAMQGSMKRTFKGDLSWDNAWSYNVYYSIERFWELDTWWYMPIVNEYKGLQSIYEPASSSVVSDNPSWFHDHLEVKNIMFHP